jgi:hypothetical protein
MIVILMADWDNRASHDTPKKARVRGAIEYMEVRRILRFKTGFTTPK